MYRQQESNGTLGLSSQPMARLTRARPPKPQSRCAVRVNVFFTCYGRGSLGHAAAATRIAPPRSLAHTRTSHKPTNQPASLLFESWLLTEGLSWVAITFLLCCAVALVVRFAAVGSTKHKREMKPIQMPQSRQPCMTTA